MKSCYSVLTTLSAALNFQVLLGSCRFYCHCYICFQIPMTEDFFQITFSPPPLPFQVPHISRSRWLYFLIPELGQYFSFQSKFHLDIYIFRRKQGITTDTAEGHTHNTHNHGDSKSARTISCWLQPLWKGKGLSTVDSEDNDGSIHSTKIISNSLKCLVVEMQGQPTNSIPPTVIPGKLASDSELHVGQEGALWKAATV